MTKYNWLVLKTPDKILPFKKNKKIQ